MNLITLFLILFAQIFQNTEIENNCKILTNKYIDSEIVAKVGNIRVTKKEFLLNYEFGPAFTKKIQTSKEKHLQYMIYEKLLALECSSIGLDTTRQVKNYLNSICSDLATEELFKDEIVKKIKISDKEIDTVITKKSIDVKIKWLFSKSDKEIISFYSMLKNGIPFDTLFYQQYNNKLKISDRELKTTRYLLGKKNPGLGKIVDTLENKHFAKPVFVNDGWYIIYLDSFKQKPLLSETEYMRLRTESVNVIKKKKMDSISDRYINKLMLKNEPVIKSNTFSLLRSYLGNILLDKERYEKWTLSEKMKEALSELEGADKNKISSLPLVKLKSSKITISQFLEWFWLRDQYLKFNKNSLEAYSISLRNIIFRMVRDQLLIGEAKEKGYFEADIVKEQYSWWKEKVLSSTYKNYLKTNINISEEEITLNKQNKKILNKDKDYTAKLYRTVQNLKQKYPIYINNNVLNNIRVSEERNPNAVNLYTVKKGGLIPRTPYPTIDSDWINWE